MNANVTAEPTRIGAHESPAESIVAPSPGAASMVDAIRVIASVLIIWIHVPQSDAMIATTIVGRFAVPFFVFAAVFFATQNGLQKRERTVRQTIGSRFRRIYAPFVVWSVIYVVFKGVKLLVVPNQPNDFPGWEVVFVGTAYHLWFLPFIFFATVAAFAGARSTAAERLREAGLFVALLGVVCCSARTDYWQVDDGFKYAFQTMPAALWAFGFATIAHQTSIGRLQTLISPVAFFIGVLSLLAVVAVGRNVLFENVAGMSLFVWAYWRKDRQPLPAWISHLAKLSFGIYLSHMLFIKVAEALIQRTGLGASVGLDIALMCGVTAVSIAACASYREARKRFKNTKLGLLFL